MNQDDRNDLLPGLRRFGDDLERAAERRAERRPHGPRLRRPVFVVALLFLLLAGAAGAALLISVGEPVKPRTDAPPNSAPRGATVIAVTAADPDGTLPWAARISTSLGGKECIVAGRLKGGDLGQLEGRTFHPLPRDHFGACGRLTPRRFFFTAGAAPGEPNRGLVYGRAGSAVRSLVVTTPRGVRRVPVGPGGAFLLVFDGPVDGRDVVLRPRY